MAEQGTLRQPAVLERQVERMLADPRARRTRRTTSPISGSTCAISTPPYPDPRLFPDFDDNLRQAMRRETQLFFESIVDDDRPVVELLTADYSFLNERLAKHYGVPERLRQPLSARELP